MTDLLTDLTITNNHILVINYSLILQMIVSISDKRCITFEQKIIQQKFVENYKSHFGIYVIRLKVGHIRHIAAQDVLRIRAAVIHFAQETKAETLQKNNSIGYKINSSGQQSCCFFVPCFVSCAKMTIFTYFYNDSLLYQFL